MPWMETVPVDQRSAFIADHRRALYPVTELCARYGISRKTGYKWLERFDAEGRRGLVDRSRAPHHCPHRIDAVTAELLCAARRKHPDWGAGKLLDFLAPRHPTVEWPAVSTVAICSRGAAWCRSAGVGGPTNTPGSCHRPRPSPTISGRWTSRDSSRRGMASTAIRSRSRTSTPASC